MPPQDNDDRPTLTELGRAQARLAELESERDALRQQFERLSVAAETSDDGLWAWPDLTVPHQWWSPRLYELLGLRPDQAESSLDTLLGLLHPDDRTEWLILTTPRAEPDRLVEVECRLRTSAGPYRWFRWRGRVLADADGRLVRMAGTVQDITNRRHAEEQAERLDLLARATSEAVCDANLDTGNVWRNQVYQDEFGIPAEARINETWWSDRIHPEDRDAVTGAEEELLAGNRDSRVLEYRLRRADGEYAHVSERVCIARDAAGRPVRLVASLTDITERILAERSSRESEERFRSLFANAPIGIYRTSPDGRILMGNHALCRMLGYASIEDLAARNLERQGYHPDCPRTAFRQRIESTGQVLGLEATWIRKDGTPVFVRESARVVRDTEGRTLYYEGTVEDITDRRRADQRLRDHAAFVSVLAAFRGVTAGASEDEVWRAFLSELVDAYGFVMAWYGQYTDGTVVPRQSAGRVDRYLDGLVLEIREPDAPDAQCAMSRAILSGVPFGYADLANDEGFRRWRDYAMELGYRSNLALPLTIDRKTVGGIMVYGDQTNAFPEERVDRLAVLVREVAGALADRRAARQAEAALQEHMRFLGTLINEIPAAVFWKTTDGIYRGCNDTFCEWLGRPRDEIIGQGVHDLYPRQHADTYYQADRQIFEHPGKQVYESRLSHVDGSERDVLFQRATYVDANGNVAGLVGIATDISERKRQEEALTQYRNRLEELVEQRTRELRQTYQALARAERLASIGTLASGLAHELNNPLGTLLLGLDSALEALDDRAHLEQRLRQAVEDVRRCARIVRGVLQFARQQATEKWRLDLNDVVRQILDHSQEYAGRHGVELEMRLAPQPVLVTGNATELEQVGVNLVHNAVDASERGGLVVVVTEQTAAEAILCVRDRGCGMTPEQREHAFDPFYTTRLEQGGTGLGLSTAHGIVTAHNGTIRISSKLNAGTTFTVTLPRSQSTETGDGADPGR